MLEVGQEVRQGPRPAEQERDRLPGVEVVRQGRVQPFDELLGRAGQLGRKVVAGPLPPVAVEQLSEPIRRRREALVRLAGFLETLSREEVDGAAVVRVQVIESEHTRPEVVDRLLEGGDVPERLRHLLPVMATSPVCIQKLTIGASPVADSERAISASWWGKMRSRPAP